MKDAFPAKPVTMPRPHDARPARLWPVAALLGGLTLLTGCHRITPLAYRGQTPALHMRQFFDGTLHGTGIVFDRSGLATTRFHVAIDGHWTGDTGILDVHYTYSDGDRQERIWTVHALPDAGGLRRYTATAGDTLDAAHGSAGGNALHWRYRMALQVGSALENLSCSNWMFLMGGRTLQGAMTFSAYGLQMGSAQYTLHKG